MTTRRHLLMSVACLAAAGAAYQLKPRKRVTLVGKDQIADLTPTAFGSWISRDTGDPLALQSENSLVSKLYNQLVTRVYVNTATGAEVMVLLAYGAEQTDDLQLHRPEVCYPAFGFKLTRNEATQIALPGGAAIPARQLWAVGQDRQESVIYWSRIGETLPLDGEQQRWDRLRIAFEGVIPDGVLSRFSIVSSDPDLAWKELKDFIAALITAMPANKRQVLIGTERARAMAAVKPPAAVPAAG